MKFITIFMVTTIYFQESFAAGNYEFTQKGFARKTICWCEDFYGYEKARKDASMLAKSRCVKMGHELTIQKNKI